MSELITEGISKQGARLKGPVFSFGELLLRLSPVANGAWIDEHQLPVYIGGAELNMATALACWDIPVQYFTALPDNYLAHDILVYLAQKKIDTRAIHMSGSRIGTYYLQQGKDLKQGAVIYDRANSSFAELKPGTIDWDTLLTGVGWFHFSAISPALNAQAAEVCTEVLQAATRKKIPVSVDLNYRAKLWQYGKQPLEIMPGLLQYCTVVMGNIWSANTLLNIPVNKDIHFLQNRQAYLEHAVQTATGIQKAYPTVTHVANTFRFDTAAGGIDYYATLFNEGTQYHSAEYSCSNVKDKIGSGDCFMAGLIRSIYTGESNRQTIGFATAAAFGKLQETGDTTTQTIQQVKALIQ